MALDQTRPLKMESPQEGGSQLDWGPTELNPLQDAVTCAGVYVQDPAASAVDTRALVDRAGQNLRLTDGAATHLLKELVSSSSGQVGSHNALLDIVHFLDGDGPGDGWPSGAYNVLSYAGPFVTSSIWYTGTDQAKRIVACVYAYSGPFLASAQWTLYGTDGATAVRTLTDSYTYSGAFVASRSRTWS